MEKYPLLNWIPNRLNFDGSEILCEWLYVSDLSFTEPFFESTITDCKNFVENQKQFKPSSTLCALEEFSENSPYLDPTAFIFHVSRSGSTLLSQLFSLDKEIISISEAPILDEILREINFSKFDISENIILKTFKSAINLLGKKRIGNEQSFFIKCDSWHMMYYATIRKAYPDTPFIFSHRKPDEVIKSHKKQPGIQAVPGLLQPAIFGIDLKNELLINHDKYIALVLEKYFEKMIEIANSDKNTLFIDYANGIFTNMEYIQTFLKLTIKESVKKEMAERSRFHSKKPFEVFNEINKKTELPYYQKNVEELYQNLIVTTHKYMKNGQ